MRLLALIFLLLLCSCMKTHERLITAIDECGDIADQNDPEDARDVYDNCLMLTDEELKSTEGCLKKCKEYCAKQSMNYDNIWIDFAGCRCSCKLKLG